MAQTKDAMRESGLSMEWWKKRAREEIKREGGKEGYISHPPHTLSFPSP